MNTRSNSLHHGTPAPDPLEPIAIVGMACRLPGGIHSPSDLWELLASKKSTYGPVPKSRFTHSSFYHPSGRPGSVNIPGGHFLTGYPLGAFDASFFSISPREANSIDPQQRMLLEVTWECLESAGVRVENLKGKNVGVYIGAWTCDYEAIQKSDPEGKESSSSFWITGTGRAILSNRVSYVYDLKGPSMTIDTGCSASGMALHVACQALRDPSSQTHSALVGGTNLMLTPEMPMAMANMGVFSPTGSCKTFDTRADGYGRGEGINCIYLKRLRDAFQDGDPIRAIIRSSGVNSDGTTLGITSPSALAQEMAIREAYAAAGITDFNTTAFVECHGTGTRAGDPIEARSIGNVFGRIREKVPQDPLYIGSVKANLGHSEGASALSSVLKAVLSLEAAQIPPNINFEIPNPQIKFDAWKLQVPTELLPWPKDKPVKRISVSSYGYGGSNAHIILDDIESYCQISARTLGFGPDIKTGFLRPHGVSTGQVDALRNQNPTRQRPYLLTFSARTGPCIKSYIKRLASMVSAMVTPEAHVQIQPDLAYTLGVRRSQLEIRAYGVVSSSISGGASGQVTESLLASQLTQLAEDVKCFPEPKEERKVGWVFTGQGAQWATMGIELMSTFPLTARTLERLDKALKTVPDPPTWNLKDELRKPACESRVHEPQFSQALCTAVQICIVDLLRSWNIRPRAVVGHSSGEIAAAYAAGSIDASHAIMIAYYRGLVCEQALERGVVPHGGMLAIGVHKEDAAEKISRLRGKVGIACLNSPKSVTISGDVDAIEELQEDFTGDEVFVRRLNVQLAYHSHHMKKIGETYQTLLTDSASMGSPRVGFIPMFSSVTRALLDGRNLTAAYWRENLESTVQFSEAARAMLDATGLNTLIEIGAHNSLSAPIRDICASMGLEGKVEYIPTLIRDRSASVSVLNTAGTLYGLGYTTLNLEALNGVEVATHEVISTSGEVSDTPQFEPRRVLVDLPTYAWDHSQEYWLETRRSKEWRFRKHGRHDLLGSRVPGIDPHQPQWMNVLSISSTPWLKHHQVMGKVIFPATGYICMAVEALTQHLEYLEILNPDYGFLLRQMSIQKPLILKSAAGPIGVANTDSNGIEIFLTLKRMQLNYMDESKWFQFTIRSTDSQGARVETITHCRGLICAEKRHGPTKKPKVFSNNVQETWRVISPAMYYESLTSAGLTYEGKFAQLKNLKANTDVLEMVAESELIIDVGNPLRDQKDIHSSSTPTCVGGVELQKAETKEDNETESYSHPASDSPISSIAAPWPEGDPSNKKGAGDIGHTALLSQPGIASSVDQSDILQLPGARTHCNDQGVGDEANYIESRYVIHPINLDHLLQLVFGTLHGGKLSSMTEPLVPNFIQEIYLAAPSEKTTKLDLHCQAEFMKGLLYPSRVWAAGYNIDGSMAVYVKDVHGMFVGSMMRNRISKDEIDILRLQWMVNYDCITQDNCYQVAKFQLPKSAAITLPPVIQQLLVCLTMVAAEIIHATQDMEPAEPHFNKLLAYARHILSEQVQTELRASCDHGQYMDGRQMSSAERQKELDRLAPDVMQQARGEMIYLVYKNILPLFRGEIDPFELYATNDCWTRLNYTDSISRYRDHAQFYATLAWTYPCGNFIEVGAGTGGLTQVVLDSLTEKPGQGQSVRKYSSYTFTDVSLAFVSQGRDRFQASHTGMQFRTLDISKDPLEQGYDGGAYDVVLASNVLHATRNIQRSLANITKLLGLGGKFVMVEALGGSVTSLDYPLALGTLRSFWVAEEDNRQLAPILSKEDWVLALEGAGLHVDYTLIDAAMGGCVISSTYIGKQETLVHMPSSIDGNTDIHLPIFVVQHGNCGTAVRQIGDALRQAFPLPVIVINFDSSPFEIPEATFVVSLVELEEPLLYEMSASDYCKVHQMVATSTSPTLWVTMEVHIAAKNPKGAIITGLARTARHERITSKIHLLDLSTTDPVDMGKHVTDLLKYLMPRFSPSRASNFPREGHVLDWEFCEYDGLIHVPRITLNNARRVKYLPQSENHDIKTEPYNQKKNLVLNCTQLGLLDSLVFEEVSVKDLEPPVDHIEIVPDYFGLNFKDVATAMGRFPATTLGAEVTGTVTKVGSGVHEFQPGDKVFYVGPTGFGNRIYASVYCCEKLPLGADPLVFTASIVVYITVLRAVKEVAQLAKGESILIHSAAGGIGIAAIHYAKLVGAQIYATCGSTEKRKFLTETHGIPPNRIFSSRDVSFRAELMEATHGVGVDVILNSLTGELLAEGWKCLAQNGRFIEIGMRDILLGGKLDLTGFRKNAMYAAVELSAYFGSHDHQLVCKRLLRDFVTMYTKGLLPPIGPITQFPISQAEQAFRYMSTGTHIGKIVVTVRNDEMVQVSQRALAPRFDPQATYLLIGGLGGIGCSIATWMAENGARHLSFMSRSGESSTKDEGVRKCLQDIAALGCAYDVVQCDVGGNDMAVREVIVKMSQQRTVRGVVHAAMVIKDGVLENMTLEDFSIPLHSKVKGLLNLQWAFDSQAQLAALDFFVVLSSISGIVGLRGQANYAAAGAFEDSFVRYRQQRGQHGSVLDLGPVSTIGYVSKNPETQMLLKRSGISLISPKQVHEAFRMAIDTQVPEKYLIHGDVHALDEAQMIIGPRMTDLIGKEDAQREWMQDPKWGMWRTAALGLSEDSHFRTSDKLVFENPVRHVETHSEDQVITELTKCIMRKISAMSMAPLEDIQPEHSLQRYGMDSLVAGELRNWIWKLAMIELSMSVIAGSTSIRQLAEKLYAVHMLKKDNGGSTK